MAKSSKSRPAPAPAPVVAKVVPVDPIAPAQRRGTSTVPNAVAVTWAVCLNMTAAALAAGEPMPSRSAMHKAAMAEGVTFYTARTQVDKYRRWAAAGGDVTRLPKAVSIG